jgi:hypothetical protein
MCFEALPVSLFWRLWHMSPVVIILSSIKQEHEFAISHMPSWLNCPARNVSYYEYICFRSKLLFSCSVEFSRYTLLITQGCKNKACFCYENRNHCCETHCTLADYFNRVWYECAVSKGSHKTKKHNLPQQTRRTCKRTNSTVTRTTQWKKAKKELASRPTRMRNYFWIILFTLYWIRAN